MPSISPKYLSNPELAKWWMHIESVAKGKSDEAFLGEAASIRKDRSFDGSVMDKWVRETFVKDGYIVETQKKGWYRKVEQKGE